MLDSSVSAPILRPSAPAGHGDAGTRSVAGGPDHGRGAGRVGPARDAVLVPARGRRRFARAGQVALVVLVGAALMLTGCGLPSQTEPKFAGPAQSAASVPAVNKPPKPDDATSAAGLVSSFMEASVGANLDADGESPNNENRDRLRQFMTKSMADRWKPNTTLVVIRAPLPTQAQQQPGVPRYEVQFDVVPIGTMDRQGILSTQSQSTLHSYRATFTVVAEDGKFRISDIQTAGGPEGSTLLLLSEGGLKTWYDWQSIYFWETGVDSPKLVPDLRYMPTTLPAGKKVSTTLDWLKAGPSPLLGSSNVVDRFNFETKDNPVQDNDGSWTVNLSPKAAGKSPEERAQLARQLKWSLPGHPTVHLKIEGQPDPADSDSGYENDNVAHLLASDDRYKDERFFVTGGVVRPVPGPQSGQTQDSSSVDTPLFAPAGRNASVVSAAMDRQMSRAALVCQVGKNVQLFVNSPDMPQANPPQYLAANFSPAAKMSRPAWMTYPVQKLLIAVNGVLYASTDEKATNFQPLGSSLLPMDITAFAVAPEGHRIALIAGGQLRVASLQVDTSGSLVIGTPQTIATSLGSNEGVDWLTETVLVVGGKPSAKTPDGSQPYSVLAITLDGGDEFPLPRSGPGRQTSQLDVSSVVARVGDPLDRATLEWISMPVSVMVEVGGQARGVYRDSIEPLPVAPQPSASPEASTATAPFYLD